jgi:hypothetical protein
MKIRTSLRVAAGLAAGLAAAAVQAHPGHGLSAPSSLMHVLEADHVVPLLAGLALGWGVVLLRAIRRRRSDDRKPRQDR